MPPRKREPDPPVTTRLLAPPEAVDADEERLLYRAVPQVEKKPSWLVTYEWINPKEALRLLATADQAEDFRNRILKPSQVRRWNNLLKTNRFVNFLPNGVLVLDEDGVMLNGFHRMTAIAGQPHSKQFGFVVFHGVPRWMFRYFDTGANRSIKDVFYIGGRASGPQTPSAMKLGMRYEEFLQGIRPGTGWRHWSAVKDEHNDVDDFLGRRDELNDWYGVGELVARRVRLLPPSAMVFRFYQSLDWPEGDEKIAQFLESLTTGGNLSPQSPVLQLREWARTAWYEKERLFAKRELHLMLLFRTFEQYMNNTRIQRLTWAYGIPMTMPYHPKGFETGLVNVKKALAEMDGQ